MKTREKSSRTFKHEDFVYKGKKAKILIMGYQKKNDLESFRQAELEAKRKREKLSIRKNKCPIHFKAICVDWYIDSMDFKAKFGITTQGDHALKIDAYYSHIKKQVEKAFPDVLLVLNYTTVFTNHSSKNNGIMVYLTVYMKEQLLTLDSIAANKPYLLHIMDSINALLEG